MQSMQNRSAYKRMCARVGEASGPDMSVQQRLMPEQEFTISVSAYSAWEL